ncbi:MAG: hypothetical protein U0359_41810 [Byssovorax sp.]
MAWSTIFLANRSAPVYRRSVGQQPARKGERSMMMTMEEYENRIMFFEHRANEEEHLGSAAPQSERAKGIAEIQEGCARLAQELIQRQWTSDYNRNLAFGLASRARKVGERLMALRRAPR